MPRQLTATKTSHKKWIHIFCSLYRDYSNWFTLSNASELFWSWISINHIQVHKEKENFVIACLRPSQNVKLGIFNVVAVQWRQRNVQKSVMHVQSCYFALSSFCVFYFLTPPHLKLDIIYDTLWSVRNRIFSVQIELLLLIASETFFDLSVVPSFQVRKA